MSLPKNQDDAFLFGALMESTADSIYFKDLECRLLRVSRKMAKDLGFSDPAELIGKTDIDLFGEVFGRATRQDDLRIMEMDRPIIGMIESRPMGHGRMNWTLTTKLPFHDETGAVAGLMGITREINEIRETEVALQHLATHDALTDLPNRFLMVDRLSQLLAGASRSAATFAVLFMDIDGFKGVNDSYGHEVGDLLLREMARRLTACMRHSDTVARIGGDEFVIILDRVHEVGEADAVAVKILEVLAAPYLLQQHTLTVTVSIGVSFYPQNGEKADRLISAADYAMYLAKRAGGNRHVTCRPGLPGPGEVLGRE
jgi:diguanylate cyclase (GGDEF)-like protein/PAS domain S-box-containing protein